MTQRSNVAKKIIKNTIYNIRAELPKLADAEKRIAVRLSKLPNDERLLEQEATIKTRAAIYRDQVEQLEDMLEAKDIHLVSRGNNRAIIRIDGTEHTFTIIPAKIATLGRGLTSP